MQVRVRLFAALAEAAGTREIEIDVPAGSTAGAVRDRIVACYPQIGPLCARAALAVNAEYSDESRALGDGDEVALIPPVSGG